MRPAVRRCGRCRRQRSESRDERGGGDRLGRAGRRAALPAARDPGGGAAGARRAGAVVGGRRRPGRRAGGAGRRRRGGGGAARRCRRRCATARGSTTAGDGVAVGSRCRACFPACRAVGVGARTRLGPRWIGERGQATVELVAALPALLLAGYVALQLLAAGYALTLADGAAEAARWRWPPGGSASAARDALPGWARTRSTSSVAAAGSRSACGRRRSRRALAERLAVTGSRGGEAAMSEAAARRRPGQPGRRGRGRAGARRGAGLRRRRARPGGAAGRADRRPRAAAGAGRLGGGAHARGAAGGPPAGGRASAARGQALPPDRCRPTPRGPGAGAGRRWRSSATRLGVVHLPPRAARRRRSSAGDSRAGAVLLRADLGRDRALTALAGPRLSRRGLARRGRSSARSAWVPARRALVRRAAGRARPARPAARGCCARLRPAPSAVDGAAAGERAGRRCRWRSAAASS